MNAASGLRTLTSEHTRGTGSRPGTAMLSLRSARTGTRAPDSPQSRGRRRPEAGSSSSRCAKNWHLRLRDGKGLLDSQKQDVRPTVQWDMYVFSVRPFDYLSGRQMQSRSSIRENLLTICF